MEQRETRSKFLKVRCNDCKNEQIIFGNAASKVECQVCNKYLALPSGGRAKVNAIVLEAL